MPTFDLTDEERDALIRFLSPLGATLGATTERDRPRFPLSQRLAPIRAILAKLQPPPVPAQEKPKPRISAPDASPG